MLYILYRYYNDEYLVYNTEDGSTIRGTDADFEGESLLIGKLSIKDYRHCLGTSDGLHFFFKESKDSKDCKVLICDSSLNTLYIHTLDYWVSSMDLPIVSCKNKHTIIQVEYKASKGGTVVLNEKFERVFKDHVFRIDNLLFSDNGQHGYIVERAYSKDHEIIVSEKTTGTIIGWIKDLDTGDFSISKNYDKLGNYVDLSISFSKADAISEKVKCTITKVYDEAKKYISESSILKDIEYCKESFPDYNFSIIF